MPALRTQVLVALGAVYLWNGEGEDVTEDLNFDLAIKTVFLHEGGLSMDPSDPGNWTGGKAGIGILKGTNLGISAAQFPDIDIANLTEETAKPLYKEHFYDPYRWRDLPVPLLVKSFDASVNMGAVSAIVCLQRACRANGNTIAEDGYLGSLTLRAVGMATLSAMYAAYKSELAAHYRLVAQSNPKQAGDLAGWLNRAYS